MISRRLVIAGLVLACGLPAALAQEGDNPAVITAVAITRVPLKAIGYDFDNANSYLFEEDDLADVLAIPEICTEYDIVYIDVLLFDEDLWQESDDPNEPGEPGDQTFFSNKQSLWLLDFGVPPVPEPFIDEAGGITEPPNLQVDNELQIGVFTYVFMMPKLTGPNQYRLQDPENHPYDVGWLTQLCLSNTEDFEVVSCVQMQFLEVQNPILAPSNPAAIADAGADRVVGTGATVTLDAGDTFDATNMGIDWLDSRIYEKDTLHFTWEAQTYPAGLTDAERLAVLPVADSSDPALATTTLPVNGEYVFRVFVHDGVNLVPSTDSITITVVDPADLPENNLAPSAIIAAPSDSIHIGDTITLDGSGSVDPDGDTLNYRWVQTDELGGELPFEQIVENFQPLSGLLAAQSSWRAVAAGTYYFRLLVTDPYGNTDADSVAVEVLSDGTAGETVQNTTAADQTSSELSTPAAGCGGSLLLPFAVVPGFILVSRRRFN